MTPSLRRTLVFGVLFGLTSCHRTAIDLQGWRDSCTDYCDTTFECFEYHPSESEMPIDAEECQQVCDSSMPARAPDCVDEHIAYFDCLAEMTCSDMDTFYDDPFTGELDGSLCFSEFWAYSICEPES